MDLSKPLPPSAARNNPLLAYLHEILRALRNDAAKAGTEGIENYKSIVLSSSGNFTIPKNSHVLSMANDTAQPMLVSWTLNGNENSWRIDEGDGSTLKLSGFTEDVVATVAFTAPPTEGELTINIGRYV